MVEIVDFKNKEPTVAEVIDWLRAHDADGNIHKLAVTFESKDERLYSKNINMRNKDYAFFLMKELNELFNGED
jgi:hypothetical protein